MTENISSNVNFCISVCFVKICFCIVVLLLAFAPTCCLTNLMLLLIVQLQGTLHDAKQSKAKQSNINHRQSPHYVYTVHNCAVCAGQWITWKGLHPFAVRFLDLQRFHVFVWVDRGSAVTLWRITLSHWAGSMSSSIRYWLPPGHRGCHRKFRPEY